MRRMTGVVALSLLLGGQPAWAARTVVHEAAESQEYGRKFGGMIGRGALNVLTSFVDVLVNTVNETKAGPPFVGTLTGLARGTGCGVLRLGSGAVDLVTFWVPGFNGFPVSDSYENCLATDRASALRPEVPTDGQASLLAAMPAAASLGAQAPPTAQAPSEETPKKRWQK